jgi:hypothetical protein
VALPFRSQSPTQAYEALKKAAADARRHQDKDAYLNISFYLGEQYVEWVDADANIRSLPRRPKEKDYPRPVVNKIMHFVNANHAFALQAKPIADILPANDSPLSVSDANVATAYVNHLMDPNVGNWRRVLSRATLWALIANEAYIKWVYNPLLKRPEFIFCPSTDIYSDPFAREFEHSRYVIHSQFLDPEQVYDLYGVEVKASKVEKADLVKNELLRDLGQVPVLEGVTVNELWHRPSRRFPDGLYVVWSGDTVLHREEKFPYDHGQLPFTQIGAVPRPGSKHFSSPVTFLRAPQVELNKYHAQRIAVRENFGLLKYWIPEGVELEEDPDNSPNQILRGGSTTGEAPQILGPPGALPDNADGEWLRAEMQNVVGIHEVSQGQVPGRVEAAAAIELLRESDASRLAELLDTTSDTIAKGFWQVLMLARQYVKQEVVVNAYSKEGVAEVKRFYTKDFDPAMRVKVSVTSGLAYTRAARMDQLVTLWQQGVLTDAEAFAELAELPVPTILTTRAHDVRLARNENLIMADGKPLQPNSYDDHAIHLREHNAYRKTAEFQASPRKIKEIFEFHCTTHEALEIQQMQKDLQKQAMAVQLTGQAQGQPPAGPMPGGEGLPQGPPTKPEGDQGPPGPATGPPV